MKSIDLINCTDFLDNMIKLRECYNISKMKLAITCPILRDYVTCNQEMFELCDVRVIYYGPENYHRGDRIV